MTKQNAEFWKKAAGARQNLADQYASDPAVTLIDIGYPPQDCAHGDRAVIRIHVTEQWSATHSDGCTTFQREADGIPVCVVRRT